MRNLPQASNQIQQEKLAVLENDIAQLEAQLLATQNSINQFSAQVRAALHAEIAQYQQLSLLYKQKQAAKKAKRTAHKKRSANKQVPTRVNDKPSLDQSNKQAEPNSEPQLLKSMYKEAIAIVHPDKHANASEEIQHKAGLLSQELIELYQDGDLEKLSVFYAHIVSGNAMLHKTFEPADNLNGPALQQYLLHKKTTLTKQLNDLLQSDLYREQVKHNRLVPYLAELRSYLHERIAVLSKRTKKMT